MSGARAITRRILVMPFERFFRLEAAGSLVLLGAAVLALAWANSPLRDAYGALWHTAAGVSVGPFGLEEDLQHWVNDGLMAVFFLLVGLEIKREFLSGQLSTREAAILPIAAALGGMVAPALLYWVLNQEGPGAGGWAIPMATDIAFALGALAVLGRRVPSSLRVFLAAAAVVDDLGAIMVIALFFTPEIHWTALLVAGGALVALIAMNWLDVREVAPYLLVGVVLWVAVLESGVHATLAGVVLAFTIPALPRRSGLADPHGLALATVTPEGPAHGAPRVRTPEQREGDRQAALLHLEQAVEGQEAPLTRLEHGLVPLVAFGVMPVFALANAGVALETGLVEALTHPVSLGILAGLVLGKQIGVMAFSWAVVRLGLARLPEAATWRHMYGVAWLTGIGFTMSLFIGALAVPADLLPTVKVSIFTASLIAGVGGLLLLGRGGAWATPRD